MSPESGQSRPADWRLDKERKQFIGEKCTECGEIHFPAKPICPHRQTKEKHTEQTLCQTPTQSV